MGVTEVTHDTCVVVKTSKFARACRMLLPELGTGTTQGDHTDMARHTKIKLAALATSFVAALGVVAVSPVASADAGKAPVQSQRIDTCC